MSFAPQAPVDFTRRAVLRALALGSSALALAAGIPVVFAQATDAPVQGGNLVFTDVAAVTSWQTQRGGGYSTGNVLHQILDRLTYYDPDQRILVPWIASAFAQNDTATEFTFTIRPDITFSDGSPLDAEAVKQNYDLLGQGNAELQILPSIYISNYDHAEVIAPDVVKIVLKAPNASFLFATSSVQSGLVALSTLALNNVDAGNPEKIIGSGPFTFASLIPDQQIVLKRRADYAWAPASAKNQGAPYIDTVTINVLPEVGLRAGALTSGQIQLARGIQPTDEAPLGAAGFAITHVPAIDLTANFTAFRPENPIIDDINVRRALNIGFDRERLVTVLGENYKPAYTVLNSTDPNVVEFKDQLAFDPDGARKLLEDAGWTLGADGIREKAGQKLHLVIPGNNSQQPAVLLSWQFIQEQWRTELGVDLDIRAGDPTFATLARSDATVPLIPLRTYQWNGLANLFIGKAQASLMFADPDLVVLFEEESRATDPAQRKAIFGKVQQLLIDKAYVIPTSDEVQVYGQAANVHVDYDSSTHPNFQGAWIGTA